MATTRAPWRATYRLHWAALAPISSSCFPRDLAEQAGVGLAQALGPPDEVVVAEEGPVLGVVAVRLDVPPGPVRPRGLDRISLAPGCRCCCQGTVTVRVRGRVRASVRGLVRGPVWGLPGACSGACSGALSGSWFWLASITPILPQTPALTGGRRHR